MSSTFILRHCILGLTLIFLSSVSKGQKNLGIFDGQSDVGSVLRKGKSTYNQQKQDYQITGGGTNIWFGHDEFQYAWKKLEGDFILHARASFIGKGVDPHRKLGWMVRSSLDSNATMIAATVHGDGLTSLQHRKITAANIEESRLAISAPDVVQLERKGNVYTMSVAKHGQPLVTEKITIDLPAQVYAGLFVCSHNKDVLETATFDNVRIIIPAKETFVPYRDYIGSHIEVLDVQSGHRQIIHSDPGSLQAPNWTRDGKSLIYNQKGLIYRIDIQKPIPEIVNTDFVKQNNNDHVLSFDGKMLGLSSSSGEPGTGSLVYTVRVTGGVPKRITKTGPSYLHGWSPDGRYLLYTAQRNNEFDIYRIPSTGGEEQRMTQSPGLDDGAEYSPDGKSIYFNSVRSGNMQIWRMDANGANPKQVTFDSFNNWFPHISPDGKSIVMLSYMPDIKPDEHPFYKQVFLRYLSLQGGEPKVIAYVYGGQGTINTPSWSPDGKKMAFVSNSGEVKSW